MVEETEEVELARDHRCCLAVALSISNFMRSIITRHLILILAMWNWGISGLGAELQYQTQTNASPLKGLEIDYEKNNTFIWRYLSLRSVMIGPNEFDWSSFETSLEKTSSQGRHQIIRPVLDLYSPQHHLPSFLTNQPRATYLIESPQTFFGYPKGGIVPVYSNANMRAAITNFITVFAAKYDGDPRIGFIEVGLIGTWGEWWNINMSRWPQTLVPPELTREVLELYQSQFKQTKILARWPDKDFSHYSFGYHDDWFAFWKNPGTFYKRLTNSGPAAVNRWKTEPVGARLHPEFCDYDRGPLYLKEDVSVERFIQLIQRQHVSWIRLPYPDSLKMIQRVRPPYYAAITNLIVAAQRTGYELYCSRSDWHQNGKSLNLSVTITNTGVAPFYYPWKMELGLVQGGQPQKSWSTSWDIRRVIPGEGSVQYDITIDDFPFPPKQGKLALRIVNPLPKGYLLRFANKTQDADLDGWLTLGEIGKN